jgi:hypothetical protein
MRKAVHALATEAEWESVTPDRPCPVCGSLRGCSTHSLAFVSCERIASQWPLTTGAWLHRLADGTLASDANPAPSSSPRAAYSARAAEPVARLPLSAGLSGTRV